MIFKIWILWAILGMVGSTIWYIAPRLFPSENPFSVGFFCSLFALLPMLLLSKIFYGTFLDTSSWKQGAFLLLAWTSTVGIILALNSGGKLGTVGVIVEFSVILAAISGFLFFGEKLVLPQILGILLAISGIGLVLLFEKS